MEARRDGNGGVHREGDFHLNGLVDWLDRDWRFLVWVFLLSVLGYPVISMDF